MGWWLFGALYPPTTVRRRIKSVMDKNYFSGAAVMSHYNETYNGNRLLRSRTANLYSVSERPFRGNAAVGV